MADPRMTRKDFIASIVLIVFSITIIVISYTMPRLERRGIDPLSAPGVVPGMIGLVLLCLALILFIRSIRNGGYRIFKKTELPADGHRHQGAVTRVSLTLIISLIYAIGFLGHLNYSIGTGIFIFSFICLFEIQSGQSLRVQMKIILLALIQAVVASVLITLVFQNLFLIDLP
ncbi:MAG: tripartite tricarboxylate transporter TctB family protein [Desulfobulbaceae bacterium]|nr:tripartite tricarboxylate transporter TctB family protein [Desulfobulbaceae bacterium]